MTKAIYLASPYTTDNYWDREERWDRVCEAAAKLMIEGHIVFSPVAHSHPIAQYLPENLVTDHDFWMKQDIEILLHCSELVVLKLDGWEQSKGVAREIQEALDHGIPVRYMEQVVSDD